MVDPGGPAAWHLGDFFFWHAMAVLGLSSFERTIMRSPSSTSEQCTGLPAPSQRFHRSTTWRSVLSTTTTRRRL
eukprot:7572738-Pyramimonas_sp.AAC.1